MKLRGNSLTQFDSHAKKAVEKKSKHARAAIVQWLAPIVVLLIVIIVMLVNLMDNAVKSGEEKVTNVFTGNAGQYSTVIYNELDTMTKTIVPMSRIADHIKGISIDVAVEVASVLADNSKASLIVVCGRDGKGIESGGRHIDITDEAYFREFSQTEQQYFYVESTPILEVPAVVTVVPVVKNDEAEAYILGYYSMDSFGELINKIEHDNETFYAIMTEQGEVLSCYGKASTFLKDSNLMETLDKANIYQGSTSYTRQRLTKFLRGNLSAQYQGESRMIFHAPLHINGWQFVMGVNQSYADLLLKQETKESRVFVQQLMTVMCIFFALIVGINFFIRLRTNENSKVLEKQADTDLLTGLNNKIATERKIKEYMKDNDEQALMFLLDIDNFKKINDTMGHAFGDEVLRALGFGLAAEFRVSDIIGRTGGDEFMIFLKGIKDQSVIDREASRVVRFFHEFKVGDVVKYSATASIGCAIYPNDADNFEGLYKAADKALYTAKKRGKNQLAFYREQKDSSAAAKAEIKE